MNNSPNKAVKIEELKKEYIRSAVLGTSTKRRSCRVIKSEIQALTDSKEAASLIAACDAGVSDIRTQGVRAAQFAAAGIAMDTIEFANIVAAVKKYGPGAVTYCADCWKKSAADTKKRQNPAPGSAGNQQPADGKAKKISPLVAELQRNLKQVHQRRAAEGKSWLAADGVRFPAPAYDPAEAVPFNLLLQKPARSWTIMVDETGSNFTRTGLAGTTAAHDKGKFAALLIPESSQLPAIGSFHAKDTKTSAVLKVLKKLLTNAVPCGIIGVTLEAMPEIDANYWYTGLERLTALILRFLPLDGGRTVLDFWIEERECGSLPMVRRSIESSLYRLAKVDQARADSLDVRVHVEAKTTTEQPVFLAYNGYVDALACAWNDGSRYQFSEVLSNYGLNNTCLLNGAVQEIYETLDWISAGAGVTPVLWSRMLMSEDNVRPDSLVAAVLTALERRVGANPKWWRDYLDYALQHLDSKAIDLKLLDKQISFLIRCQPDDAEIPPQLQLLWMTARLAAANHRGAAAGEAMPRFRELIRRLFAEDAPLCCFAALHLAVSCTNVYEFAQAGKIILDYLKLMASAVPGLPAPAADDDGAAFIEAVSEMPAASSPAAVPGLRYWGQLLSSRGQHEAFLGNELEAVHYLQLALDVFNSLSDRRQTARESRQTTAYLITVLMDCRAVPVAVPEEYLVNYLGTDLENAAEKLAADNSDERKYQHHLLLRYLVSGHAAPELKKAYLEQQECWKTGCGHPWEMIEFYRALLAADPDVAMAHLKRAHELSQGYDAALHVIDSVILGAILLTDSSVLGEYRDRVEQCVQEIPALGEVRIRTLREQPEKRLAPLELARIILPFNFR